MNRVEDSDAAGSPDTSGDSHNQPLTEVVYRKGVRPASYMQNKTGKDPALVGNSETPNPLFRAMLRHRSGGEEDVMHAILSDQRPGATGGTPRRGSVKTIKPR